MLEENLIDGLLVDTYNGVYPMRYVSSSVCQFILILRFRKVTIGASINTISYSAIVNGLGLDER